MFGALLLRRVISANRALSASVKPACLVCVSQHLTGHATSHLQSPNTIGTAFETRATSGSTGVGARCALSLMPALVPRGERGMPTYVYGSTVRYRTAADRAAERCPWCGGVMWVQGSAGYCHALLSVADALQPLGHYSADEYTRPESRVAPAWWARMHSACMPLASAYYSLVRDREDAACVRAEAEARMRAAERAEADARAIRERYPFVVCFAKRKSYSEPAPTRGGSRAGPLAVALGCRRLGIELELEHRSGSLPNPLPAGEGEGVWWTYTSDASLGNEGVELKLAPLAPSPSTETRILRLVGEMREIGFRGTAKAGMHVSVDRRDLAPAIGGLRLLFRSRRYAEHSEREADRAWVFALSGRDDRSSIDRWARPDVCSETDHYSALSIQANALRCPRSAGRGAELRIWRASSEPETVLAQAYATALAVAWSRAGDRATEYGDGATSRSDARAGWVRWLRDDATVAHLASASQGVRLGREKILARIGG